jgi:hypothetical protein
MVGLVWEKQSFCVRPDASKTLWSAHFGFFDRGLAFGGHRTV